MPKFAVWPNGDYVEVESEESLERAIASGRSDDFRVVEADDAEDAVRTVLG